MSTSPLNLAPEMHALEAKLRTAEAEAVWLRGQLWAAWEALHAIDEIAAAQERGDYGAVELGRTWEPGAPPP